MGRRYLCFISSTDISFLVSEHSMVDPCRSWYVRLIKQLRLYYLRRCFVSKVPDQVNMDS